MARYNIRLNEQVYLATSSLNSEDFERSSGAYFDSIQGTLNHILVGDIVWFSRFREHSENYKSLATLNVFHQPKSLSDILYCKFSDLQKARKNLDSMIEHWVENETNNKDFERNLTYKNTKGISSTRNFGELLHHVFNHQTHHRGQVSTLLNQLGLDIGVTDFLIEIPS